MAPSKQSKVKAPEKAEYLPANKTPPRPDHPRQKRPEKTKNSSAGNVEKKDDRDDVALPDRPSVPGTRTGITINLQINSFCMDLRRVDEIFVYDLEFCPDYDPGSKRRERRLFQLMLDEFAVMNHAATDYKQTLVSTTRLTDHDSSTNIRVVYYEHGSQRPPAGQNQSSTYWIYVGFRKILFIQPFRDYLNHAMTNNTYAEKEQVVTALNLLMSRVPGQNNSVHNIGKTRIFNTSQAVQQARSLQGGLEAYIGFEKSVRTSQTGSLLNINASTSAFYRTIRVDHLIDEWAQYETESNDRTAQRQYTNGNTVILNKFLRGVRVRATYTPFRFYSIWRVAEPTQHWTGAPTARNVCFEIQEEGYNPRIISVFDYFMQRYPNQTAHVAPDVLVIDTGSDDHAIYIPSSLLNVLPGNHHRHVLSGNQQSQMISTACRPAYENQHMIVGSGLPLLGLRQPPDPNGPLNRFSINVDLRMLKLNGYSLRSPTLHYRTWNHQYPQNEALKAITKTDWGNWNLQDVKFVSRGRIGRWSYVELNDGAICDGVERNAFLLAVRNGLRRYCGFADQPPFVVPATNNIAQFPRGTPLEVRNALARTLQPYKNAKIEVLFVILSSQNIANYAALKLAADVMVGIHTTAVVKVARWRKGMPSDKPRKPGGRPIIVRQLQHDDSVIGNILHKVNLRLGGVNTRLSTAGEDAWRKPRLFTSRTMIVGADVTHPGTGSKQKCPSIAAVVASSDADFNHYTASLRCQEGKKEQILDFGPMLVERLNFWKKNKQNNPRADHQLYPEQLVFYRDGVSEGQFQMILKDEWPQIESSFRDTYDAIRQSRPKSLLITSLKRHATRFFPESPQQRDHHGNPRCGLVVDRAITYERGYDFYLQSHPCLQGTARPAHYVVLFDSIGLPPDVVQRETYEHCFLFGRCSKAIGIHPAARYADRACDRGRNYLQHDFVARNQSNQSFDPGTAPWTDAVHPDMADSMFFI